MLGLRATISRVRLVFAIAQRNFLRSQP